MNNIVTLSGSPSELSRSEKVLHYLGNQLSEQKFYVTHISVKDVPYEDLFTGNFRSTAIKNITQKIQMADGVIVGSPVYKGAYSGVLKALIDILPQDVLKHTPVLPIMTGGSPAHLLAVEYTLKPVLATLKAHNLKGLYFLDEQINKHRDIPIADDEILQRTKKQVDYFAQMVEGTSTQALTTYL
ncbi:NADH-dependent FMN reductase [Oceanobacillus iheyensis HTE831]|uniref:NADH-dependent FMN reductase n=1 Tax=Oceanobacillus iheyensis (strain DSM 14371 / CIP 107618 / JCM 11309 / KCTC 3954 / HTE831) TaxID=221109 RepID=Q8ELY5_OCEIH|nr:NADPH-dependent FMN reductase [Oceanobacillus iheyensis]BAC15035.1 NADH-dependent FMN reductase [Oceanobacillus iheyensis HTE831]